MFYRCRQVAPSETLFAVISSDSPEDASNEFHLRDRTGIRLRDGSHAQYAIIEVDGVGRFVSRIFWAGIGRRGGVRRPTGPQEADTLAEVATMLGVSASWLDENGWIGADEIDQDLYSIPKLIWDVKR